MRKGNVRYFCLVVYCLPFQVNTPPSASPAFFALSRAALKAAPKLESLGADLAAGLAAALAGAGLAAALADFTKSSAALSILAF